MPEKSAFQQYKADDSPGFLLYRVTILWQKKLGEIFESLGITQTQYAILASLKYFEEHDQSSTQTDLVEHARIDKMTLSKSIRILENGGLVNRQTSLSDSRAITVRLTAKGRKLVIQAIESVEKADEQFFGCMTTKQREQFKGIALTLIDGNADLAALP